MLKSKLAKIAAVASVLGLVTASVPVQAAGRSGRMFIPPMGGHSMMGGSHSFGMGNRGIGGSQRNFAGGQIGNGYGRNGYGNGRNSYGYGYGPALAGGLALGALAGYGYYNGYGYDNNDYADDSYLTGGYQGYNNNGSCSWVNGWHNHSYGWYQRCY